jgi:superfamily II DNA/RNA helicase
MQRDGYSTLLLYFNSLRELGGAIVQILDDVPDSIGLYAASRAEDKRQILHHEEMTSRKPQDEILRILEELKLTCDSDYFVDAVLATNMVSVGVDISRLGLMLVNGQPKTRAEYIQATSRVGRSSSPGLIVSVLNAVKPRDRSHFETFQTWHSAIYKDVEATSVTPFAPRARDKALKAVIVTMVRQGIAGLAEKPAKPSEIDEDQLDAVILEILRRAQNISPDESNAVAKELEDAFDEWEIRSPTHYENPGKPDLALIQRAEEQARRVALRKKALPAWPIMNSMRNVEPSTKFRITERLKSTGLVQASDSGPNGDQATDKAIPTWRKNRGK